MAIKDHSERTKSSNLETVIHLSGFGPDHIIDGLESVVIKKDVIKTKCRRHGTYL